MIYSNCRFTLDIQKLHSQVSVPVSQGDTAKTFLISLKDGVEPYFITTGCLAMLSIKRPSGTYLQAFCTILDNTVIKYDFSENENTAIEEGLHDCELTLYGPDGGTLSSSWFTMVVNARVINSDNIDITDEDITAVDAMLVKEAARQVAETERSAAEKKRASAEASRAEAETERSNAETERAEAETLRADAEEGRVTAEEERALTFEQIKEALANDEFHPKYTTVTLLASAWVGAEDPYAQVVTIEGVTEKSKVDLLPSVEQLAIFHDKDLAFVTENEDGVVTVYAIGDKPTLDYTIEVCISEVKV